VILSATLGLAEEQNQIYQLAHDFALNEMKPHMQEWDQEVCLNIITHFFWDR
jgi:hypothetical protein